MKPYLFACLWLLASSLAAQAQSPRLSGRVLGLEPATQSLMPLPGARVSWLGTTQGTLTDSLGYFSLAPLAEPRPLLVSYAGYEADTLTWQGRDEVVVTLQPKTLADVEISRRKKATRISAFDPMQTRIIGEGELLKAACCNLSESFETSPSVDVAFTDAVTGTRQIQMLGLAGPYTQITRENMPSVRGLSAMYGLTYVPGTWVESIQLNKGTGSVVNGYEAIAGQLNVELRKPETADRAYVNGYANVMGRLEGNVNLAHRLDSTGWSTALLLHASTNPLPNDRNQDGFLDNPLGTSFIGLHRWKYAGAKGLRFQAGVNGTYVDQQGGQVAFDPDRDDPSQDRWGMQLQTRQLAGWAKLGKVFPQHPWRSVGLQLSVAHHQQHSYFGPNQYDGQQQSAYANFVYQGILGNSNHTFRTGASLLYDDYAERFNQQDFTRMEVVPGAYFEYTYQFLTRFSAVAGLRADYHNLYGAFITPRLHVRYAPTDQTVIRASLGRGQRTASILAENNGLLASSRQVLIEGETPGLPYGLSPEIAWNFGLNLTQDFRLDYRDGQVTVDAYRTEFVNQIVIDRDRSPQQVAFYNLSGRSFSNSVQAQVDYELLKFLDLRLAYRWLDVRTTYDGVLLSKPLIPTHRAFLNLAYATREDWVFDLTVNWQGSQRLPSTASNPEPYRLATRSPSVILVNAQVSKQWGDHWEVYLGGENLLDQRQERPILSAEAPFSDYFDSSVVWGPIFGRNVYLGFRYRLK